MPALKDSRQRIPACELRGTTTEVKLGRKMAVIKKDYNDSTKTLRTAPKKAGF